MAVSISVIINTRNEEANIARAMHSVKDFADEVIVVDMESEDRTVEIAKKHGAIVYYHKKTNYVEPARNFAIKKVESDWIFILDADEEAPKKLLEKLQDISMKSEYLFARIPRKNIVFGKWMEHSRWWPDYNIRFFKKGAVTWGDEIHSIPVSVGEGYNVPDTEDYAIIHHNYQTVEQFVERLNRYTTIQAKNAYDVGKRVTGIDFIKKPSSEFLSRYFAGKGYKDGTHGLALCLLQSFSELTVVVKMWQLQSYEPKKAPLKQVVTALKETQKEANYWTAEALIDQGAGVHQKVKRKFKLF